MNATTPSRATVAVARLVAKHPFFGSILLRLDVRPDPTCKTAWIDGRSLGYNEAWVESLTNEHALALFAHEAGHVVFLHPHRLQSRDRRRWNEACDYAINEALVECGFTIPPEGLQPQPRFKGKCAEEIYALLVKEGAAAGDQDSAAVVALGELRDAPGDLKEADSRQMAAAAAAAAKLAGKLPASLDRSVSVACKPEIDWREELRRYMAPARTDTSWRRPSRRSGGGVLLPGLDGEECGEVVLAIDTSGSIGGELLDRFCAEVKACALDANPSRIHVVYCDAEVGRADTFERGEDLKLSPVGGGGTDFRPVWTWIEESGIVPECIIYLTDLEGCWPESSPWPTLWVCAGAARLRPPFGDVVVLR